MLKPIPQLTQLTQLQPAQMCQQLSQLAGKVSPALLTPVLSLFGIVSAGSAAGVPPPTATPSIAPTVGLPLQAMNQLQPK